jgi:general secretion pathway protein M
VSQWWTTLSRREQALLTVLALIVLALIAWYGVWRPLTQFHRTAVAQHELALGEQQRVQALIARLKTGAPAARQGIPVAQAVRQSLEAAGITAARLEADPSGGLRVAVGGVPSNSLFPWMAELQGRHGVTPQHLLVVKAGQGVLQLDATFVRDGS